MVLSRYLLSRLESSILGRSVSVSWESGEILFHCQWCTKRGERTPDHKGKLYVNPVKGWFICHRCKFKGNFEFFSKVLGLGDLHSLDDFTEKMYDMVYPLTSFTVDDDLDWPKDAIMISQSPEALEYMKMRSFSEPELLDYSIMYSPSMRRVLIPVFTNGCLDYWTGRSIDRDNNIRYLSSSLPKRHRVFNLDRAIEYPEIIVCEGPLSAMSAGMNGIAIFGSVPTPEQYNILRNLSKRLYIALEIRKYSIELCDGLHSHGRDVYLVELEESEDANSLGRGEFLVRVKNSRSYDFTEGLAQRMF